MPLSTLHARPYGRSYMTQGRCDWLGLHRTTLAFATPHRFIPALPPLLHKPQYTTAFVSNSLRVGWTLPAALSAVATSPAVWCSLRSSIRERMAGSMTVGLFPERDNRTMRVSIAPALNRMNSVTL